jgi:hypothetical protein
MEIPEGTMQAIINYLENHPSKFKDVQPLMVAIGAAIRADNEKKSKEVNPDG